MRITVFFLLFALTASLNAQQDSEKNYIEQDQEIVLSPPQTASSGQALIREAKKRRIDKTIDRYIPDVMIVNQLGDSLELTELITKKTYIGFGDFHCGFGTEHIQTVFPELLECSYYREYYNLILLVGIDSASYVNSEKSREDLDWHLHYYRDRSNVFFISSKEAKKLNFFSSPSHMVTTVEGQAIKLETGLKDVEYLLEAIESE